MSYATEQWRPSGSDQERELNEAFEEAMTSPSYDDVLKYSQPSAAELRNQRAESMLRAGYAPQRDLADHSGAPPQFVPSASERRAQAIRDTHTGGHGVKPELKRNQWYGNVQKSGPPINNLAQAQADWRNEACDESGLPVAAAAPPPRQYTPELMEAFEQSRAALRAHQEYVTKDSGKRDVFETGCQRDLGEGKGAYDLIPGRPLLRLAQLYERGAKKYDDHNWRKGMPFGRVIQSMIRHAEQFKECDDSEDHLAAVAWNAFTLMEYVEAIGKGQLPAELDNRFRYTPPGTEK